MHGQAAPTAKADDSDARGGVQAGIHPASDEAQPQTALAACVHVLRIKVLPLLRLRDIQAVLQTCRATRRLLVSGNSELQDVMRRALPHGHPLRLAGPQPVSLQQDIVDLAAYQAQIGSSRPTIVDELQMGPEPGGMKAAYSSLSPSGLCAAVMHGSLPGLPSFLHLVYLLDQGVSHPVSSLMGLWTGHAAWSPSGAHFLAAEFSSGLRIGIFEAASGTWQQQALVQECDRPTEAPPSSFSDDEQLAVLQGERAETDGGDSSSAASSGDGSRPERSHSSAGPDWQYLVLLRLRPVTGVQLVPIKDLRAWAWLPGTHRLLVVRESGMRCLDADDPDELPTLEHQLQWREVPEFMGPVQWRTRLAVSSDGKQCAVLRELTTELGHSQEECHLRVLLLDTQALQVTSSWEGPTLQQDQMFWYVDYCKHASISFGVHGLVVWRIGTGVHVLGLAGDQLTGVLFRIPGASAPHFSPDGHALALILDGKVTLRHSRSGRQLLESWHPSWRWPQRMPAPSPFTARSARWGGHQARQLHVLSTLNTPTSSRVLFSVLSLTDSDPQSP